MQKFFKYLSFKKSCTLQSKTQHQIAAHLVQILYQNTNTQCNWIGRILTGNYSASFLTNHFPTRTFWHNIQNASEQEDFINFHELSGRPLFQT